MGAVTLSDLRQLAEELADELDGADYRRARTLITAIDFMLQEQRNRETASIQARQHRDPGDESGV